MKLKIFTPKYSLLTWALVALYCAPYIFSLPNALFSHQSTDWKLFWLLAGAVWLIAGLMHLKAILLKRITIAEEIIIEMALQKTTAQPLTAPIHIWRETARFAQQDVHIQFLANADVLMQLLVSLAGQGEIDLIYEDHDAKRTGWTTEKNLICLIVFALYMLIMLALHLRPVQLIGPATDALLLGWALMLPVLLAVKGVQQVRERAKRVETPAKWV